MKYKKLLVLGLLSMSILSLGGCHSRQGGTQVNQTESSPKIGHKEEEISKGVLESFESTLKYYPTPNIEDVLDENMGKQAILQTRTADVANNKEDTPLVSKGLVLYMDTQTKKGHGFYFENKFYNEANSKEEEKKYPVTYDHGIHLKESTGNQELDKKIEHFKFLFQYANFGDLSKKKLLTADYNSEVPLFSAEYQLSNSDAVVQKLRKEYDFDQKEAPVLVLDGRGDYKEEPTNNFDYRHVDIYFSRNPTHSISSGIVYTNNIVEEGDY